MNTTAHDSKSGKFRIVLSDDNQVWTIRTGTHDLGPHSRRFETREDARRYANQLWRSI